LDLGCGSSNTGNEIDVSMYDRYTGVDISEIAIQKAVTRSLNSNRQDKNEFFCADIAAHVPRRSYDIILFRESLFYIPLSKRKATLDRYSNYRRENGVFVVRMCDRNRYNSIVRVIERSYHVLERSAVLDGSIILVFR
jgi:2-polyprenyl-6-hydroxyphenyl methylase/3-demethylubiquinone-9 3-methyltransferase